MILDLSADLSFNDLSKKSFSHTPKWCVDSIKLLLFIVYFYAGLAKINKDWLMEAQPLKIWLTTGSYDLPIIGSSLMQQEWFHYFMSWGGMFYDLLIPFILLYHRTRIFGFLLVIFFLWVSVPCLLFSHVLFAMSKLLVVLKHCACSLHSLLFSSSCFTFST